MAVSAGAVSIGLILDDASLQAALAQLEQFAQKAPDIKANVQVAGAAAAVAAIDPLAEATARANAQFETFRDLSNQAFNYLKGSIQGAVDEFTSFNAELNNMQAVTGATDEELKMLADESKRLGIVTSKSPQEAAAAATEYAKLGNTARETAADLEGLVRTSEATGLNAEQTASIIGAGLSVYGDLGYTAESVGNMVVKASNASSASAQDFGQLFSKAGALGKTTGQDLETLVTVFGALRTAGNAAEVSATAVRNIIQRLSSPSDVAAKAIAGLGVAVRDEATGELKNILKILPEFKAALENVTPAERDKLVTTIFGADTSTAFLSVLDQAGAGLNELEASIRDFGGAAAGASQAQLAGLSGSLQLIQGSAQTVGIVVGEKLAPAFNYATQFGLNFLNTFLAAPPVLQSLIIYSGGLALAVTGLAVAYTVASKMSVFKTAQELYAGTVTALRTASTVAYTIAENIATAATSKGTLAAIADNVATGIGAAATWLWTAAKNAAAIAAALFGKNVGFASQQTTVAAAKLKAFGTALGTFALMAAAAWALKAAFDAVAASLGFTAEANENKKAAKDIEELRKEATKTTEQLAKAREESKNSSEAVKNLGNESKNTAGSLGNLSLSMESLKGAASTVKESLIQVVAAYGEYGPIEGTQRAIVSGFELIGTSAGNLVGQVAKGLAPAAGIFAPVLSGFGKLADSLKGAKAEYGEFETAIGPLRFVTQSQAEAQAQALSYSQALEAAGGTFDDTITLLNKYGLGTQEAAAATQLSADELEVFKEEAGAQITAIDGTIAALKALKPANEEQEASTKQQIASLEAAKKAYQDRITAQEQGLARLAAAGQIEATTIASIEAIYSGTLENIGKSAEASQKVISAAQSKGTLSLQGALQMRAQIETRSAQDTVAATELKIEQLRALEKERPEDAAEIAEAIKTAEKELADARIQLANAALNQLAAQEKGARLDIAKQLEEGKINLEDYEKKKGQISLIALEERVAINKDKLMQLRDAELKAKDPEEAKKYAEEAAQVEEQLYEETIQLAEEKAKEKKRLLEEELKDIEMKALKESTLLKEAEAAGTKNADQIAEESVAIELKALQEKLAAAKEYADGSSESEQQLLELRGEIADKEIAIREMAEKRKLELVELGVKQQQTEIAKGLADGSISQEEATKKQLDIDRDAAEKKLELARQSADGSIQSRKDILDAEKELAESEVAIREAAEEEKRKKVEASNAFRIAKVKEQLRDREISEQEANDRIEQIELKRLKNELAMEMKNARDSIDAKKRVAEIRAQIAEQEMAMMETQIAKYEEMWQRALDLADTRIEIEVVARTDNLQNAATLLQSQFGLQQAIAGLEEQRLGFAVKNAESDAERLRLAAERAREEGNLAKAAQLDAEANKKASEAAAFRVEMAQKRVENLLVQQEIEVAQLAASQAQARMEAERAVLAARRAKIEAQIALNAAIARGASAEELALLRENVNLSSQMESSAQGQLGLLEKTQALERDTLGVKQQAEREAAAQELDESARGAKDAGTDAKAGTKERARARKEREKEAREASKERQGQMKDAWLKGDFETYNRLKEEDNAAEKELREQRAADRRADAQAKKDAKRSRREAKGYEEAADTLDPTGSADTPGAEIGDGFLTAGDLLQNAGVSLMDAAENLKSLSRADGVAQDYVSEEAWAAAGGETAPGTPGQPASQAAPGTPTGVGSPGTAGQATTGTSGNMQQQSAGTQQQVAEQTQQDNSLLQQGLQNLDSTIGNLANKPIVQTLQIVSPDPVGDSGKTMQQLSRLAVAG